MARTNHPALDLEEEAWEALSSSGEAATAFFRKVLAAEPLMLLPGGLVIDDREAMIDSVGGPPWSWHRLDDRRVQTPTPDTALVTYRASARRAGMEYQALMSSLYVRDRDRWTLAFHQQTPVAGT